MRRVIEKRDLRRRPKFVRVISVRVLALLFVTGAPLHSRQQSQQQKEPQQQTQQKPQQQPEQKAEQTPQLPSKIAVEANMVTVFASVRDKKGQIVPNLTEGDFSVDEDGRAQTISYFARENDLPLTVGLLVDTSLSQRRGVGKGGRARPGFFEREGQ